jgi:hypothetical protein
MTKKLALALAALALATPALAQDAARPQFGIGIAIVPLDSPGQTIEVYAPINVAPQLRLEPSLGISTSDGPGNDTSNFTLGLGAFYVSRLAAQLDMYAGGRLKLNFASVDAGTTDDSGTDISLAGALGGEYYLVPRFSLGLEGQLGFFSNSDVSGDDSGLFTTGLAFLRLYF